MKIAANHSGTLPSSAANVGPRWRLLPRRLTADTLLAYLSNSDIDERHQELAVWWYLTTIVNDESVTLQDLKMPPPNLHADFRTLVQEKAERVIAQLLAGGWDDSDAVDEAEEGSEVEDQSDEVEIAEEDSQAPKQKSLIGRLVGQYYTGMKKEPQDMLDKKSIKILLRYSITNEASGESTDDFEVTITVSDPQLVELSHSLQKSVDDESLKKWFGLLCANPAYGDAFPREGVALKELSEIFYRITYSKLGWSNGTVHFGEVIINGVSVAERERFFETFVSASIYVLDNGNMRFADW